MLQVNCASISGNSFIINEHAQRVPNNSCSETRGYFLNFAQNLTFTGNTRKCTLAAGDEFKIKAETGLPSLIFRTTRMRDPIRNPRRRLRTSDSLKSAVCRDFHEPSSSLNKYSRSSLRIGNFPHGAKFNSPHVD